MALGVEPAPLAQQRRVQALAAQQRPDLARPRTGIRLARDRQLVLSREAPALRALDELGVRDPRPHVAPEQCSPCPTSRAPFSPSGLSNSWVMSVSHDIGRAGPARVLYGRTVAQPLKAGADVLFNYEG